MAKFVTAKCHSKNVNILMVNKMEDTLRYFFSAVFQGFAAIITLGIMFYLYYLDKFRNRIEDIESIFQGFKPNP